VVPEPQCCGRPVDDGDATPLLEKGGAVASRGRARHFLARALLEGCAMHRVDDGAHLAHRSPRLGGRLTPLLALGACLCALASVGCSASLYGRALAPDMHDEPVPRAMPEAAKATEGPTITVHVVSSEDAVLVRLDEEHRVADRCAAPCDRPMPADGTYRIDGNEIRSTWPFQLAGHPNDRLILKVAPSLRSHYKTGYTLGNVGLAMTAASFGAFLITAIVATSDADANNGGPAPCAACTAAWIGASIVGLTGAGLGIAGLVVASDNYSSVASQENESGRTLRAPNSTDDEARRWNGEPPWPKTLQAPVVRLSF
jgi:hypothetical protein